MSLVMHDVMYLQGRFSNLMGGLIKESIVVLSSFFVLLAVHWQTAALVIGMSPFLAFALGRSGKRISAFSSGWQKELGNMSGLMLSIRERFGFIRAQAAEGFEKRVFDTINERYLRLIKRSLPIRAGMAPFSEFAGFVFFALVLLAIHKQTLSFPGVVLTGSESSAALSGGGLELIQFFAALGLLIKPLRNIGEQVASFQETKGALSRSLDLFNYLEANQATKARFEQMSHEVFLPENSEALSFKRLCVGFDAAPLLTVTNLNLKPGQTVAIVGPSGSGKSTLIKTLAGLIEPIEWQANLSYQAFTRQSSLVSQRPFLFDDSLRANLSYGSDRALTDDDLWQSLKPIRLEKHFRGFKDGLDVKVNAIQGSFSGGQLQRLMIARSLLRSHQYLLLDEATSALDVATEEEITRFLTSYVKSEQKLLFFITHRLKWLNLFDLVVFIDADHSVKIGEHHELLQVDRYLAFINSHD